MGQFFDSLRNNQITVDKQLINASGSKLRQYYCSFRSICEDFTISVPEYVQIFSSNVKSFSVWDPQRRGTIDAMQMFSGLILFSKMAFQDKIKFLYQIFDLNEQGFLQYDELVYLFMNVCEATCKIYQIKTAHLNNQIIEQYLDQFFSQQTQLMESDFLRWCYKCDEVVQFFQIIGHPFQRQMNTHSIDQYDEANLQSKRISYLSPFNFKKQSKMKIKLDQRFLNILKNDHILLQDQTSEQKSQQFNPAMKWVYGIRIDDIRYPLNYRKSQMYKAANQNFVYICGKNVIVLYPKLNLQRNYTNHQQPVSCVEVGQCDKIVASGEMGLYPSIHLWNIKTATCIYKFDRIHKHSIKMLKFIKRGELLITISQKQKSSVVILNIKSKQKVLSTYLIQPVLNIINFNEAQQQVSEFYFALPSFIVKCTSTDNVGYLINYHKVKNAAESKEETSLTTKIYTAARSKIGNQNMIVISDKFGNLSAFNPLNNTFAKINSNPENIPVSKNSHNSELKLVDIFPSSHISNRLYFLFAKSFGVYEIDSQRNINCICNINNIPFSLFNLQFVQLIQVSEKCVLLLSLMGDVIKVSNFLPQNKEKVKKLKKKKHSNQGAIQSIKLLTPHLKFQQDFEVGSLDQITEASSQIQFFKYYQIFKIEKISGICFLSKQGHQKHQNSHEQQQPKLVVASNSLIYIIDQIQKQLLSLQCLQQNITHIHSFGAIYAVATELKYLMILRDGITIQKAKCIDNNGNNSVINGFKITADNLIVAIDQQIHLYYKYGGNYLQKQCKKIKIDHGLPIHLSMTSIPKVFLVITRQKAILKLNSQSKQKNILSAKQLNCDFLQTYYPEAISTKAPILFSGTKKIFLLAQPNGDIHYWNSLNHLIKNQQSYSLLTGHSSYINELIFMEDGFISSGSEDGQIIIWKNMPPLDEQASQDEEQEQNNYLDKLSNKQKSKFMDQNFTSISRVRQEPNQTKIITRFYMEQIACFDKVTCDKLMLKDSQIDVITSDGELYKDISKVINHIIIPNNLELFEPLVENKKIKNSDVDKKNILKTNQNTQKQSINLGLSFVYGFNSQKIRQSLFYVHRYMGKKHDALHPRLQKQNLQQKSKLKQINFVNELLLPVNETHENCKRDFFYFTGRTGVIWSPMVKKQYQYDFHINRITCASVHPNKNIICTAEISNTNPDIHIWSTDSMTLMFDFKARHNKFVSKIQFSRDGDFIVSLGGPPFQQSIQIYNWIREERICFKYIEQMCFYDIKPNPYDFNELAVCGLKSLWIMRVSNRTLIKKQQAKLNLNEEISCMVYTSSVYGNSIQSDIITGNSNGDLSLFICGKYIPCKKSAHEKSINCLKICELFKYKTVVISASQDNTIKFWDTKFNQITCINVKQVVSFQKSINQAFIAPQSIDIYQCFSNKDMKNNDWSVNSKQQRQDHSQTILLVGTRNGSIFQVKISNQFQGLEQFATKNSIQNKQKHKQEEKLVQQTESASKQITQKLQLNYICHFNNLPPMFNRSGMFDIKGNLMISYSKTSQYFALWNLDKRQIIKMHKMNSYPSFIKFSKTHFISICYLNGRVQFLQISNSFNFTVRQQKICMDEDYQPLSIVFSQNDNKIAVLFSKQQQKRLSNNVAMMRDQNCPNEGDQILMIYQKMLKNNQPCANSQKYNHCISAERRKFRNVYWYDFNSEGNKLLICFTFNDYLKLNNQNRKRMMGSLQGVHYQPLYQYILYDIAKRNIKQITNQQFNVLNFSPAVRAKYRYYQQCKVLQDSYRGSEYDQMATGQHRKKLKPSFTENIKNKSNEKGIQMHSARGNIDQLKSANIQTLNSAAITSQVTQQFVPICQMAQFQNFTLMGTVYGEVFAIPSGSFYLAAEEERLQSQVKISKAKCYTVFDSAISNMQVIGNRLFVSAKDYGTIAEFTLNLQTQTNNISLQKVKNQNMKGDYAEDQKYYETYTTQKIQNWLKYIFPKRRNYYQIKQNCEGIKQIREDNNQQDQSDQIILQPYHIIGRNAYYKRNNVLIDLKDNLITFSGCNLLIMTSNSDKKNQQPKQEEQHYKSQYPQKIQTKTQLKLDKTQPKKQYKQQFLKLDNSVFSVNPQISTITLSHDKRTLYAGTTQENCQVIIWDISTRTELQHISFKGYVSIILIKISEQQKYAIVLALNKQSKQVLFFISLTQFEIIASYCISGQLAICDFQFLPSNQFKFLACGTNYIGQWALKGGLLTNQKYSMKNPKDFSDSNDQKYGNKAPIIFYSIIFLKDVAITGGSDGYLYMWNDRALIKKQNANPKSAILTLYATKNSKIFASGAVDGRAIIWQLGSSSIIQKVFQFSIYPGKQSLISFKFHIQSVNIGKNQIFIGTRSGQIHRFQFNSNQSNQMEDCYNQGQNHSLILSAFDNDRINSCSFNISFQKLYILSQSGIFSVFNLQTNQKIKQQRIKNENDEIVKMLVCKLSSKIYIIFKRSIESYTYIQQGKFNSKLNNKFSKSKQMLRSVSSEIKAGILSLNERFLALLMSPNHVQNAKIQIYDMSQSDGKQFFVQYKVLENIPANIQTIDFSTDNGYLIYKKSDEQETIIDLTTKSQINTKQIQFQLQWNQQAKKTSKYIRQICSTYSDENKLKTVVQIMNHSIIITDEMGSLRIFKYEQNIEQNSIQYYRVYLQHLNDVYLCIASADCSTLVTVGKYDKSIIIWRIKNFDIKAIKGNKKKQLV